MLVGVMLAEEKYGSRRQLRTHPRCCTAAVAAVCSSQFGTGQSCVHGFSVPGVSSLCQTYGDFALFPDRCEVCRFSRVFDLRVGQADCMSATVGSLVHMCGAEEWLHARHHGCITPQPGAEFIHLSTPEQVHLPSNRLFHGRPDLVLLHIDPAALQSPVRWEPGVPTDPASMLFPHLYGPLPVQAVVGVTAYRPGPDGTFGSVSGLGCPPGDCT